MLRNDYLIYCRKVQLDSSSNRKKKKKLKTIQERKKLELIREVNPNLEFKNHLFRDLVFIDSLISRLPTE